MAELPIPPDPMTSPCFRFYKDQRRTMYFVAAIAGLAQRADEVRRVSSEALYEVATDEAKKEAYKKSIDAAKRGEILGSFMRRHGRLIAEMLLTTIVDNFLAYISELMALVFRHRPETLRSSETVRLDFVLQHGAMEDLIAAIADKRVSDLSYRGMRDLADELAERLGFILYVDQDDLKRAIRLIEIRNLIVHNRGLVNRLFLSRIPDYPAALGKQIELDGPMVVGAIGFLAQSVTDIDTRASAKFALPRADSLAELERVAREPDFSALTGGLQMGTEGGNSRASDPKDSATS